MAPRSRPAATYSSTRIGGTVSKKHRSLDVALEAQGHVDADHATHVARGDAVRSDDRARRASAFAGHGSR